MKTMKRFSMRVLALAAVAFGLALTSQAQTLENFYADIDWQYNIPKGTNFVKKGSGWGMNFEGGYYLTENLSVGAFLAYHSNHRYIPRQTMHPTSNSALNADQQHTYFQLPFGAVGRYTFNRGGLFQPYFSLKLGPQYARLKTEFNALQDTDNTFGLYVSPEFGANLFPWVYRPGIHVAAYYSYATNKGHLLTYDADRVSNFGFRVGVAF